MTRWIWLPARIGAATYHGRFREAADLLKLWESRMEQSGRGAYVAEGVLTFAINEALVGFGDRARARLGALRAAKRLTPGAADEWLVLSAVLADTGEARAAFPQALAEAKESTGSTAAAGTAPGSARRPGQPAAGRGRAAAGADHDLHRRFAQHVTVWAVANRRLGRDDAALPALSWLAGPPPRMGLDASVPLVLHELADAQAATGQTAAATETRARLMELWKDADGDVPMMQPQMAQIHR